MKYRVGLLFIGLLGAGFAQASCVLSPKSGLPAPHNFEVPDMTVYVDADQVASTTTPVTHYDTAVQGYPIGYITCADGEAYGKSAMNLPPQGAGYIFPTNVPGIGLKIIWNNGQAFGTGQLPAPGNMSFAPSPTGSWVYDAASLYRIEIYKTAETLKLDPQGANIILPPNDYAYNWVISDSISNAAQILHIGAIQIVSTPSCTFEGNKTVDFGTVTGNMLSASAEIEKPLDFAITCRTDYGTYSTTVSVTSDSASTDSRYIKVQDSSGATDALAIRIKNSTGGDLLLDGSTSETLSSTGSTLPAEFHWKATLMSQPGAAQHPAEGEFTAHAEILLQVK
ncbi:fimbrial protein [Lelliottia sp. V106_10]|uniref:fimbrial protein n=1 Tax=Lelliottia wanjuensis TaxID=3050585 RepID=UPI00254A36EC|nr:MULTISPECIES: fimbrial protein [unclassified Lelliottia]MDK9357614.1 fimbrial protein [Lelliottia sp. V106_16]MDK9372894.1 fimbrial protein [Lelliottia sp. V106_10]MDK9599698.1 fimbrial protein [Lelliottia sp. V106_5]